MTKDEFLAAWKEVCVEAAAEAWLLDDPDSFHDPAAPVDKTILMVFDAIGSKLMEGIEEVDGYPGWFRLTLPKEQ